MTTLDPVALTRNLSETLIESAGALFATPILSVARRIVDDVFPVTASFVAALSSTMTFEPMSMPVFDVRVPVKNAFPVTFNTFEPVSATMRFDPTCNVSVGCVFATPTEFDVYNLPYTCTLISSAVMSSTMSIETAAAPFVHRPIANSSIPGFPAAPAVASLDDWWTYPMNALLSFAW